MQWVRNLWNDDAGFVISAELVLVSTILVIGMVVGMVEVRNQVVAELIDVAQAIGSLSQSYAFGGISKCGVAFTDGSAYIDVADFCQSPCPQVPFSNHIGGGIIIDDNHGLASMPPLDHEVGAVINEY